MSWAPPRRAAPCSVVAVAGIPGRARAERADPLQVGDGCSANLQVERIFGRILTRTTVAPAPRPRPAGVALIGCEGQSFGTLDTLALLARTHRFKAAIFAALERLGKSVELRINQGESHVISRDANVIDFWRQPPGAPSAGRVRETKRHTLPATRAERGLASPAEIQPHPSG